MIKLLVFDFNGVLIADTRACMAADNHVIKSFGGRPVSLKVYRDTINIPAIDFYALHGCNRKCMLKNYKKSGKIFHSFYEKRATKVRSRKNALKTLKWLNENGIDSIIISNHTVKGITYQLKKFGMKKYIKRLLANTELGAAVKTRNKREKLSDYIRENGIKKLEAIIIGDSPEEVEMGKFVGIKTVAITGGYYSTSRLVKSKPDFLINNLIGLIEIIKKINKV